MNKKYHIFLCALFCGVLAAVFLAGLLLPDRSFSDNENRPLQTLPSPDAADVADGSFMSEYEGYVTDQFPARDFWIRTKAFTETLLGKKENNGVYFGLDGQTLFARFDIPDASRVEKNLAYVSKLTEKTQLPVYFSLIPGKESVWPELMPENAPGGDVWSLMEQSKASTSARWLDLSQALLAHADEEIFYRTDHHWTSLGAYYGYAALAEGMGLTPSLLTDYTPSTVSDCFYGTSWSSSGAHWIKPDSMEIYVPEEGITVTSYRTADAAGVPVPSEGQLYDESFLDVKDKYSYFLGGQQPLCVIETNVQGPKLLLVRDSFSDSLAPFLTANFSQIHLLDPRYFKMSVAGYAAEHEIDQILILYSASNFVSDTNLFVLGL